MLKTIREQGLVAKRVYTIAISLTTVSMEAMTGLANTHPSQQHSIRHTNGMTSSLATCTRTAAKSLQFG